MNEQKADLELTTKMLNSLTGQELAELLVQKIGKRMEEPSVAIISLDVSTSVTLIGHLNLVLRHPLIGPKTESESIVYIRDHLVNAIAKGDEVIKLILLAGSKDGPVRPHSPVIFSTGEPAGFTFKHPT